MLNNPIVTLTRFGSGGKSCIGDNLRCNFNSAESATAFASTKINGSALSVVESLILDLNKSVAITRSEPIDPKRVIFLLKILFAQTGALIGVPSASRKVNLYLKTYFKSISQKPFLNGLGLLLTIIIFWTHKLSIVTAAAFDGGSIIFLS